MLPSTRRLPARFRRNRHDSLDGPASSRCNTRLSRGVLPQADGRVAQLVEQGIENPRVGGSIPSPATIIPKRFLLESNRRARFDDSPHPWGHPSLCSGPATLFAFAPGECSPSPATIIPKRFLLESNRRVRFDDSPHPWGSPFAELRASYAVRIRSVRPRPPFSLVNPCIWWQSPSHRIAANFPVLLTKLHWNYLDVSQLPCARQQHSPAKSLRIRGSPS